jgi:hypothetical protein
MQDRSRQLDENLLQRTAGPYIGSQQLPSLHTLFAPVVFSKLRRGLPCSGNAQRLIVEPAIEI